MHFQTTTAGWPEALLAMPDGVMVKAVNDPGLLLEAHNQWVGAGRDPRHLHLDYRFNDLYLPKGSLAECKTAWRAMFFRFVDRTYLERHAPVVTMVEENNEYFTNDSMAGPEKPLYLTSVRAAVEVWNTEFRGRLVNSPDGGQGRIRDDCRLVIGNPPVTHGLPKEYFQLALAEDAVLGYHPYTKYTWGVRAPDDWANHAGLWNTLEQRFGMKPLWAFTECGPYQDAHAGWKADTCLGNDPAQLLEAMRRWFRDTAATAAYREGRLLGPAGAWFTVGGSGTGWPLYDLTLAELKPIAQAARTFFSWKEPPAVDAVIKSQVRQKLTEALELLDALYMVEVVTPVLNVRAGAGTNFADVGDVHAGEQYPVFEKVGTWVRIGHTESRWISGLPAYVKQVVA